MFRVNEYMTQLIELLKAEFGNRLIFVGLQGSYLRNEATEDSDIDIIAIINELSATDLRHYKEIINRLPYPEKSCGFICGKEEFAKWNPLEICQFEHCTKSFYGALSDILPKYTEQDVQNYVKLSLGNIYHEICHRRIHSSDASNYQSLPYTYKNVFFILQNLYFLKTGIFYQTKKDLLPALSDGDRKVLEYAITLKDASDYNFEEAFEQLFTWSQTLLKEI